MKLKERSRQVNFVAFQYDVRVVLSSDVAASRTKRNDILGKWDGCAASGIHSYSPDNESWAYIFLGFNARPGTVAHEAWHCIRRMLAFCGAELDNEVVAYHLGYLVEQIHEFQDSFRKKQTCRLDD